MVSRVRGQQQRRQWGRWWTRLSPFSGINWSEMRAAYQSFLSDPAVGIRHILAAERHSRWQYWVKQRLACQAGPLAQTPLAVDLAALRQLPPDTLGGAYSRHMIQQGFDPDTFMAGAPTGNPLDQRTAVCHDIYHIITGFDASPIGEFGVAAFTLVQYRDLLNVFVLSFVPLSLTNPQWTVPLLRALGRGWRMGWRCQPAIAYAIEAHWDTSLSVVRQELGIGDFF